MSAPTLCTVCTIAQLPDAQALAGSWREAVGNAALIVVADARVGTLPEVPGARIVAGAELDISDFGFLAAELSGDELAAALVPFALARIDAPAIHLAPWMRVHGRPELTGDGLAVAEGVAALLTPHGELLAWWQERAREGERPALLGRFAAVRPAEGVDRWAAPRTEPPGGPLPPAPGFTADADGLELNPLTRRFVRRARLAGALPGPVFEPAGAAALRVWLTERVPEEITRVTLLAWLEYADLQLAYPDLADPADRDGLQGWLATHGLSQFGLPADLLPDLPASIATADPRLRRRPRPWGVNVVRGDGRLLEALDAARVPALVVEPDLEHPPFSVNLIAAGEVPHGLRERRQTIALWPADADPSTLAQVDEVWVPSSHAQRTLAPRISVPVIHVPPPVVPAPPRLRSPEEFVVAAHADDEPHRAIQAFERAFDADHGATLLLAMGPELDADLARAAASHPRVELHDEGDLPASVDAWLSLHPSPRFESVLTAALALGTPIVATAHDGTLELMDASSGWLVPSRLGPTGPEPDVEAAAAALRTIRDAPAAAAERAAHGRARILAAHAPATVGAIMAHRLRRWQRDPAPTPGFDEIHRHVIAAQEQIRAGVADFQRDAGHARRRVQRGVRRAGAAFEATRRTGDEALADALEALEQGTETATERGLALYADALARARRAERRLEALEHRLDALDALDLPRARNQIEALFGAARGLPFMAGDPYAPHDHPVAGRVLGYRDPDAGVDEQDTYRFFEDVFRGSQDRIRGLLAPYVELVREHAPVLDVGCGRGEFLELLEAAGIEASGVDADAGMAARATERGLAVTIGDGIEHLRELADKSLGAITAFQVIEHLPLASLEQLLIEARRKLRPGGVLILETVNPHAAHALKAFWIDPTHRHPLFPEVVLTLARGAGFREGFICHLAGVRDVEVDRFNESSYAVVATA